MFRLFKGKRCAISTCALLIATTMLLGLIWLALTDNRENHGDVPTDFRENHGDVPTDDREVDVDWNLKKPQKDLKKAFTVTHQEAQRFTNFTYLLDHPDKCSGEDVHLLLFIKSATAHADRREAIRSTWGNETYIRRSKGVTVKVLFALGAPNSSSVQEDLEREDRLHGDLIQQDFTDSFRTLTLKVIMQFRWASQRCAHASFVMTADDDTFVHTPNLVDHLQDAAQRNVTDLWLGHVWRGMGPNRDRNSKYYLPYEMYPWSTFPDFTSGNGYVVSRDVVEKIYQATLTLNSSIHMDDVVMAICANIVGVTPQHHNFFNGGWKAPYHPCIYRQMMNSHGHHGQDMYDLWKAATDPQVQQIPSKSDCKLVKEALLCKPNRSYDDTYPCRAAFE